MTLKGITDKSSTMKHDVVKFIIYKFCIDRKYIAQMEFRMPYGIFDVFDRTNGLVYEVHKGLTKANILSKTKRYTLYAGVKDVIFIDYSKFDFDKSTNKMIEEIKQKVI